jgi:hypothetical protein
MCFAWVVLSPGETKDVADTYRVISFYFGYTCFDMSFVESLHDTPLLTFVHDFTDAYLSQPTIMGTEPKISRVDFS